MTLSKFFIGVSLSLTPATLCNAALRNVDSIKGVDTALVLVEVNKPLKDAGLDEDAIREQVEAMLRKAGIRPLTQRQYDAQILSNRAQVVSVTFFALPSKNGAIIYNNSFQLLEMVKLDRTGKRSLAILWQVSGVGSIALDRVQNLRDDVAEQSEVFLNDQVKANPNK